MLRALVVLVAVEVLLLLAGAAYLVRGLVTADATEAGAAVVLVLLALGLGAGLAACARALWHRRRASRAPLLVWQVLQLAVGVPQFGGGAVWAGLLLSVPAVLVLAGLFHRQVLAAVDG